MTIARKSAIEPTRQENYAEWYQQVIKAADLAEHSPVRGCMVIKPWGYELWENIKNYLDRKFKETGHQNAYFPLFIPLSFLEKEAQHVEGFAKECAIVTHHRLEKGADGKLVPAGELEEPLIVRPTSETIFGEMFSKWVDSYRDLPLLINQWANVVRWEMRTRLFLRTAEFLWQEGHTAHATKVEAIEESVKMMNVYAEFAENFMAMPVVKGVKTESERFAGALETYCIEALMQDGKALQAGTSHFLGQNFAKAFDVKFTNSEGTLDYVWGTSWGVSTRLMGALVMTHSDDNGLVLPPNLAPIQVVIVPIYKSEEQLEAISVEVEQLVSALRRLKISVKFDNRTTHKPGFKFNEYELKGVPIRIAVGPKDLEKGTFEVARRDTLTKEIVSKEGIENYIENLLATIQKSLYDRAFEYRNSHITEVNSFDEFKSLLDTKGGFFAAHWDGTSETEEKIKELTKATIRCIPLNRKEEAGSCMFSGKPSVGRVLFAKAY